MKKIVSLSFLLFLSLKLFSQTQIVDLRTGVDDITQGPIPYGSFDDTWTVKIPGSSTFQPCYVSLTAYPSSSVDYITPFLNAPYLGFGGYYIYRMTFESDLQACDLATDALLYFNFIAGDDVVKTVSLNGNTPHIVNAGFTLSPPPPPIVVPLLIQNMGINIPVSDLVPGTNTIEFVVENWVDQLNITTPTLLNCDAYLKINYQTTLPPVNFSGTTSAICSGGNAYISAAIPGTFNANDFTMNIYELPGYNLVYTGIPNVSTPVFPTNSSTQYMITVTHNVTGCMSTAYRWIEIMNNTIPIKITGEHTFCPGGTGGMSVSVPGGASTYTFTVTEIPSNTIIYAGPAAGFLLSPSLGTTSYTVTVVDNATNCTSTTSWPITVVNNFTTMTAAPIQCIANGITVDGSASVGPFNSYVWTLIKCNSAGVPIPGATPISVFGFGQPGIYTFTAGAANLLCDNYYRISLNTTDVCGMQNSIRVQKVVFVKCCPPSPQDPPNSNMPEVVTVVYNNLEDFEALYQQFNDNTLTTNRDRSFVEESVENQLTVYPNPTLAETMINYKINDNTTGKIVVTDLSGRVLETIEVSAEARSVRFDFSTYESGIYMINLFEGDQLVRSERLIRNN